MFLPAGSHVLAGDVLSRLATSLSAPFAALDGPNLVLQDALNARVAWLWWPLGAPRADAPMPDAAHALYVVHAVVIARVAGLQRGRLWAAATLLSWALFTGAWDRRSTTYRSSSRSESPSP